MIKAGIGVSSICWLTASSPLFQLCPVCRADVEHVQHVYLPTCTSLLNLTLTDNSQLRSSNPAPIHRDSSSPHSCSPTEYEHKLCHTWDVSSEATNTFQAPPAFQFFIFLSRWNISWLKCTETDVKTRSKITLPTAPSFRDVFFVFNPCQPFFL